MTDAKHPYPTWRVGDTTFTDNRAAWKRWWQSTALYKWNLARRRAAYRKTNG